MEIERDGVRLVYDELGEGPGSAVLLHGMACHRQYMAPVAEHLADRYRCIIPDLRGHGDSDSPASGYAMDDFVADLHHVIQKLGLDRPLVVGHSFGGAIALSYATSHPGAQVSAIALLDSGLRQMERIRNDFGSFYDSLRAADDAGFQRILDEFVRARLFDPLDGEERIDRVATQMSQCPRHVFMAMSDVVQTFDSARLARECRVPALTIGSRQGFIDPAVLATLGSNWHAGEVVASGHFIQLVVPDQINAMLDRFLAVAPETRAS